MENQVESKTGDAKAPLEIAIKYKSSRKDIWRWYWRAWKKRLWVYHVLAFVFFILVALGSHQSVWRGVLTAIGLSLLLMVFPQIAFKSKERTLVVNEEGIWTSIGKIKATVRWEEIASIDSTPEEIIITRKNLNAFIIPKRAFVNEHTMYTYLRVIKQLRWKANTQS